MNPTPDHHSSDLAETEWHIVRVRADSVLRETIEGRKPASIAFHGDGRFSGTTGCNNYFGKFTVTDDGLEAGPIATTMMMCSEPLMDQERLITRAIEVTRAIDIRDGVPTFVDGDGETVIEVAAVVSP